MKAYIDTSVLTGYYTWETKTLAIQRFLKKPNELIISPLVEVELCSSISQKLRVKELDATAAMKIISLFKLHISQGYYRNVEINGEVYELARDYITRFDTPLRTLDALHLSAAFTNGLILVTADKGLAKSAKHLGITYKFIS